MTLEDRDRDVGPEENVEQALPNNIGSADPGWLSIGLGGLGEEGAAIAIVAVAVAFAGFLALTARRLVRDFGSTQGD